MVCVVSLIDSLNWLLCIFTKGVLYCFENSVPLFTFFPVVIDIGPQLPKAINNNGLTLNRGCVSYI